MQCVVKVPWMYSIYYLIEIPADRDELEREGLEIEEGAWVELPSDIADWPTDDGHLAEMTLGRRRSDPRHYKEFKGSAEAEQAGFEPTGMFYGGAYSPAHWERFVEAIPGLKAFHSITGNDRPGAMDEALRSIREVH